MRQKVTLKLIELVIVDENWISNAHVSDILDVMKDQRGNGNSSFHSLSVLFLNVSYCLGMFSRWDGGKIKTQTYTFHDVTHFGINS